jgi:hypothetical protein
MEFKDFAQNEASALLDRLTSAAQAATQKVREDYEAQLATMREQADALRAQIEQESARAAALEADLDTVIDAHKSVDGERLKLEEELRGVRELHEKARTEIAQLEEVLESEMAQKAVLENALAEKASVEADLATARATIDTLRGDQQTREETMRQLEGRLAQVQAAEASLRKQSGDTNSLLQTLTSAAEAATKKIRDETDAEIAVLRSELEAARREAAAAKSGKPGDTVPAPHQPELLIASVRAVADLGKASNVADLFDSFVRQLAPHFPRVALFRMKGKHLEGERGSGLDASTDITKLVIPMSMDSLITRAANLGTIEDLGTTPPPANHSPLGGTPAAAIALPIRFQGETLAVAYADSDTAWDPSRTAFATLLLQNTEILLTRLTQELKTLKELRDYADMLLQEAEQMFLADVEGKRPEKERVRRLQETIECGRQLYAQRSALEGPLAAGLLDARIEVVLSADPMSSFAKELAVAVTLPQSQRSA